MPTGYTSDVSSGKVVAFADFAMNCARAFGALVMMRDEPLDAEIPIFEFSNYHKDAEAVARVRLAEVAAWEPIDADAAAEEVYVSALSRSGQRLEENLAIAQRYQAMLEQVRVWTPPTLDHDGLKIFMREQLEESIKFDCGYIPDKPERLSGSAYKAQELAKADRDIAYHVEKNAEEVKRTNERNEWVRALRESLVQSE